MEDAMPILNSKVEVLKYLALGQEMDIYQCKECLGTSNIKRRPNYDKTFGSYCTLCKKHFYPTWNTPFHNVRFGLVKAFNIYRDFHYKNYDSLLNLSKKYNLTYKTIYNFKCKVDSSDFKPIQVKNTSQLRDFTKLKEYLRKINSSKKV